MSTLKEKVPDTGYLAPVADAEITPAHRAWMNAERIKRLSDRLITFGPLGVGLDGVLAWIPGANTVYSLGAGGLLIYEAVQVKAQGRTLVQMGLYIAANTAMTDEEVDNLIFLPGFSTASQVSNISGRGVGMDVVRRNIADLGGRITIGSMPQRGSRFSLTLPLLLVSVGPLLIGSFAFNFNNFGIIQLMTQGGPADPTTTTPAGRTDILISYTYRLAFGTGKGQDLGLAATISLFIFVIIAAITTFSFRYTRQLEEVLN